jgi:hypothetical protein
MIACGFSDHSNEPRPKCEARSFTPARAIFCLVLSLPDGLNGLLLNEIFMAWQEDLQTLVEQSKALSESVKSKLIQVKPVTRLTPAIIDERPHRVEPNC